MLRYLDCDINDSERCVTIFNSYLLKDDEDKKGCIKYIFDNCPEFAKARKFSSVFNEIKTHNILYQRNFQVERTRHTDLEYNQGFFLRFMYWLVSRILKER